MKDGHDSSSRIVAVFFFHSSTIDTTMQTHTFTIPPDTTIRLDHFLADQLDEDWTRSMAKRAIDEQRVTVNGKHVKAGYKCKSGDEIVLTIEPQANLQAIAQDIPLDILHEDEHLAIVNKPPGMVVHPAPGHPDGTLVNALLHHFNALADVDDPIRPGIVHRIDKDTSGSLVIAKTKRAHLHLSQLFHDHDIDRIYHAIVFDQGLPDQGTFDTLHGRDPRDRMKYSSTVNKGKNALTRYKVLERFDHHAALVACKLETGRTHQIRVHFYDNKCPLLGDTLYGGRKTSNTRIINRQALHALRLGFTNIDGSTLRIDAPYPEDFQNALEMLRAGKDWRG